MEAAGKQKQGGNYGKWGHDELGLPVFSLRKTLPNVSKDRTGHPAAYGNDPYFLIGNDALNLFVWASGRFSLLSGTYGWARLNAADAPNQGLNKSTLAIRGHQYDLIGPEAPVTDRTFGIGFARFRYEPTEGTAIERVLACPPGPGEDEAAGFLTRVTVTNTGDSVANYRYEEFLTACYVLNSKQRQSFRDRPVGYGVLGGVKGASAQVRFLPVSDDPVHLGMDSVISPYNTCPPEMGVHMIEGKADIICEAVDDQRLNLGIRGNLSLSAGEHATLAWWTSFRHPGEKVDLDSICLSSADGTPFRKEWRSRIPDFSEEADPALRRELQWHVGCLEAMAQRSGVYGETFIPQGCSYDYDLGVVASARDLLQHGLAALVYRPQLARSILRHCMKKMTPTGEIRLMETGGASTSHAFFFTSDQQLFFFFLMAEYLRLTGDDSVLGDLVDYYPPGRMGNSDGLSRIEQALGFVVHEVETGENGLLRLLCSDWNDCIYFFQKDKAYPDIYQHAESTLNAAMAVYVCGALSNQLSRLSEPDTERTERIRNLAASLQQLAERQRKGLKVIWQGHSFLPRVLLPDGELWGADDLFLEPQIFALLDPEMSRTDKLALWQRIQSTVLQDEPLGARQRENPPDFDRFPSGNRENGGVWFALNGPLIVALSQFAPGDAWELLRRNTLAHHANTLPDQWPGIWSAPDNLESCLRPTVGMPDPNYIWSDMPLYCAHPHAWVLYAWHKLNND